MQKVSKQSLAMIALSILLAISIALTFTFAVFTAEKSAKGTITFSKGFTLTTSGFTENENDTARAFTVIPTIAADGSISYAFADANKDAAWEITTTDKQILGITVTYTAGTENGAQDPVSLNNVTSGTQYYLDVDSASKSIKLANIISLATDNTAANVDKTELSYTIKVAVVSISDKGTLTELPASVLAA